MSRQFIDRGTPLQGIQKTVRDARLPVNLARSIKNYDLPDGRAKRRSGMAPFCMPIKATQLMKHTPTQIVQSDTDITTEDGLWTPHFKTPLSYGLLRWHSDYQFTSTSSKTVEFLLTLGEREYFVTNSYLRESRSLYGGSSTNLRNVAGVIVYDQAILSNIHTRNLSGTAYTLEYPSNTSTYEDVFAITALTVSYSSTGLFVYVDLYDTVEEEYREYSIAETLPYYEEGASIRVSIIYDSTTRRLSLWLNGVVSSSYIELSDNQVFAGESDAVNGLTTAIQRDIVLLNECTARGGYQSTCKTIFDSSSTEFDHGYFTFAESQETNVVPPPWAKSPPRGTGLADLRYWSEARTEEQLKTWLFRRIDLDDDAVTTTLSSYFKLSDGGPICLDSINTYRYVTVHHGEPAYVQDNGMLNGYGLVIADNQYIQAAYGPNDYLGVDPGHALLTRVFGYESSGVLSGRHDFTIQTRIRTPFTFGQEINRATGASSLTGQESDTRDGFDADAYGLGDGGNQADSDWNPVLDETNTSGQRWHRAFDATIFSIEAQGQVSSANNDTNNDPDLVRVALCRGLLTPSGKIAFEFFGDNTSTGSASEYRVVSATTLSTDTIYTITFRKRTLYYYSTSVSPNRKIPYGFELTIFIDGATTADSTLTIGTGGTAPSTDVTVSAGLTSQAMKHGGVRDINIGASYVSDPFDRSIAYPDADSTTLERKVTAQRFMSPYQDQPGFFTLNFFRLWSASLDQDEFWLHANRTAGSDDHSALVYNVEILNPSGRYIPDKGRYSKFWKLGFKSWGVPQPDLTLSGSLFSFARSGWLNEDRLGYGPIGRLIDSAETNYFGTQGSGVACKGIASFGSVLSESFGVLSVFADHIRFSKNASGLFDTVYKAANGTINDYTNADKWYGKQAVDETVLTSYNGTPKVFNGQFATDLGFKPWSGGRYHLTSVYAPASGELVINKWYGVRVLYYDDKHAIYDMSTQETVKSLFNTSAIAVSQISPHPDPRVTNIAFAITLPQESQELARYAPVYLTGNGYLGTRYLHTVNINDSPGVVRVLTEVTEAPQGAYSAFYNSRLYITGDYNTGDTVFFSDAGNIHRWDTLTNRFTISPNSSDRTVGIEALFGSLYVFKPNSIWRVDEIQSGQHQIVQVASIGPSSPEGLKLITMPDTGRVAVVMWTRHGPYLFDEVNLQYIGYPVEGPDPFLWLDPTSVFITHDIEKRQLLFHYKTKEGDEISNSYMGALVYNYRFNSWVEYTGIPGIVSLSLEVSQKATRKNPYKEYTEKYLALIGASNGRIYQLGDYINDGYDVDGVIRYYVSSFDGSQLSLKDASFNDSELEGLWITVIDSNNKQWFSVPILDNTEATLTLDLSDITLPFDPVEDDEVYLAYAPASIEFPWDVLDLPYYDKQLHRVVFWAEGELFYRLSHSWTDDYRSEWKLARTASGKRTADDGVFKNSEVFKLEIASLDSESAINAYAYIAEPIPDAMVKQ